MPTTMTQTAIRPQMATMITGLGPKRASSLPPTQLKSAAEIAPMMPKMPTEVIDQLSTRIA